MEKFPYCNGIGEVSPSHFISLRPSVINWFMFGPEILIYFIMQLYFGKIGWKSALISDFSPVTQQISALLESRRYEKWPCQQKISVKTKYSQPGKVGKLDF